jgi:hypothetical protein
LRSQDELANDYILVRRPPRAYVACRLYCNLSIAGFLRTKVVACRFLCVDRRSATVDMDDAYQGPRRSNVSPVSCAALRLLSAFPIHEPLDDWYQWYFTHPETSCLADEQDEQAGQNEEEFEQEFEEFDEGDDLEPDLAAALSTADREAADKNCLEFDRHVAEVGSSGLTVGPFRTPIEPCTSAMYNFNYTFGIAVATDKIWLVTDVISHLFGPSVLDKMLQRFVRRWSAGVYSNANTGAGRLLEHGMIAGNPVKKKQKADEWFAKARMHNPEAVYPMFTTPCGYIGEQSGFTLSCGHSCLGQIAIGQNATEKANMPMRQAFLYCTALGIPGHFKPQGRQRCIKANAEMYQLSYKICTGGFNIFEHPERFTAVFEPRLEILEFVVESYLYTELMVCRVNGTKFPYTREYSQSNHLPAQTGRGRGRSKSGRGAGKGVAPQSTPSATPKRSAKPMESVSQQKKPKGDRSHAEIMQEMCNKSGLDPEALLRQFVSNATNLDTSNKAK